MNISRIILILVFMLVCISGALAEGAIFTSLGDCLVTNDIGIYTYKSDRANMGSGSGIVGLAGHFDKDHSDTVCTGRYSNINQIRGLPHEELRQKLVSVKVQVTQHSGSDSDRWLLHEVERGFRSDELEKEFEGTIKEIDGNKIFTWLLGTEYRWISNNIVVQIEYSDQELTKPEPLEVVKAYLAKHSSTITLTDSEAKSTAHNEKWIKDEMDRRLWLGDKWIVRIETVGNLNELSSVVKSLNVFLDYREKYYGINAENEKQTLSEYLLAKNKAGIKTKLAEYKTWWEENKDKPISL